MLLLFVNNGANCVEAKRRKGSVDLPLSNTAHDESSTLITCLEDSFVVNNNTEKAEHRCYYADPHILREIADRIMSAISSI